MCLPSTAMLIMSAVMVEISKAPAAFASVTSRTNTHLPQPTHRSASTAA
jgi:hypothetical protein